MKANELMIGDWVKDVSPNGVFFYKHIDHSDIDHCFYGRATYAPIPLTAEILKKNGFVFNCCGRRYWYEGFGLALDYGARGKELYLRLLRINRHVHIHYVHELQHALRLCGMNELANNFKI